MPMMGMGMMSGPSAKAAQEAAKRSQKQNRVYVGNLAYDVKWNQLKDFMREGG
jgi:RNA recognition motif-containing protein